MTNKIIYCTARNIAKHGLTTVNQFFGENIRLVQCSECSYKIYLHARFSASNCRRCSHKGYNICLWLAYLNYDTLFLRSLSQTINAIGILSRSRKRAGISHVLGDRKKQHSDVIDGYHCHSGNTLVRCFPFKFQKFTICLPCGLPARNILWWSILWRHSYFIQLHNSSTLLY